MVTRTSRLCLAILCLAPFVLAARKLVDVSFGRNYKPTWAYDHIKYINQSSKVQLSLDKYTGDVISFFVVDIPIRVLKNSKDLGVKYPFNQAMKIYSCLWNVDYKGFPHRGCEASVDAKYCERQGEWWWNQKVFQDLDVRQYRRLRWACKRLTIYNYCKNRSRFPTMVSESKRDRDA